VKKIGNPSSIIITKDIKKNNGEKIIRKRKARILLSIKIDYVLQK
jgi:hypothetical protein